MTEPDGSYSPHHDGRPDPGEICWGWVPYEEDPTQGKDRPVLVIGDETAPDPETGSGTVRLLHCLVLTSKDHDRDEAQEARAGRFWMDVGTGAWDPRHRPSEVRLNRLVKLREDGVRREGAALDRATYDAVIAARAAYA
ncbi:type II toxin-antitoxin system PemK/MazF family toxin [Nocardioides montaniterrae]